LPKKANRDFGRSQWPQWKFQEHLYFIRSFKPALYAKYHWQTFSGIGKIQDFLFKERNAKAKQAGRYRKAAARTPGKKKITGSGFRAGRTGP
jgi:hypothetical protein